MLRCPAPAGPMHALFMHGHMVGPNQPAPTIMPPLCKQGLTVAMLSRPFKGAAAHGAELGAKAPLATEGGVLGSMEEAAPRFVKMRVLR